MPASIRPRRSVLYMPGSNSRALEKARGLPADGLIFDLEDAVAPDAKAAARDTVAAFAKYGLDHQVRVLPCGHYTTGETPYKYLDAWHLGRFFGSAF